MDTVTGVASSEDVPAPRELGSPKSGNLQTKSYDLLSCVGARQTICGQLQSGALKMFTFTGTETEAGCTDLRVLGPVQQPIFCLFSPPNSGSCQPPPHPPHCRHHISSDSQAELAETLFP
ncbi:unnamed protein product [Protopolystoma xenopodis]|uniref:Uncharacterized protein n=1 Tax=Protopolystoma xenopodis TaxID=117903 RepID=A0A3S4ZPK3_9PLAT|nr:unnamed protein product [Protopolystoma xenopodis]